MRCTLLLIATLLFVATATAARAATVDAVLKVASRIQDRNFNGLGDSMAYSSIVVGELDPSATTYGWEDRGFAIFELPALSPDEFIESATLKLYLLGRDDTPDPADLYHLQALNRDTLVFSDFEAPGNLVKASFVESSVLYPINA